MLFPAIYLLYIWPCSACSLKPFCLWSLLPCFESLRQHVAAGATLYVELLQSMKETRPHPGLFDGDFCSYLQ